MTHDSGVLTRRITAQILLLLLVSGSVYARSTDRSKVSLSEPYWIKYSLIYLPGCQPKVFPDNIIFTDGPCSDDAYSGKIFQRGTRVKINSVIRGEGFAKVRFGYPDYKTEYEVLLKYDSSKSFNRSFALLFSKDKVPHEYRCPNELTTKQQVIRCLGYPISITKKGDVERYFYILEFVGPNPFSSYDGFWVEIKDDKFKGVTGYI